MELYLRENDTKTLREGGPLCGGERGEREGLGGRGLSGIFNILFIKQNKNLLKKIVAANVIKR